MKIIIESDKANLADFRIHDLFQTPDHALKAFWKGTSEELEAYKQKHSLNKKDWDVNSVAELHNRADEYMSAIAEAVRADIGKFDFRIRQTLLPRNLAPISEDDYMIVRLNYKGLDPASQEQLKNTVLMMDTRSLIDYRKANDDNIVLIYNRRGLYDEGERVALVKAKPSVTMRDNFKVAKDNNFIMSGVLAEISKVMPSAEFSYTYYTGDTAKEMTATGRDILTVQDTTEKRKEEVLTQSEIQKAAAQEIVRENNETRGSLPPESTRTQLSKPSEIEIKVDSSKIKTADDLEKVTNEAIDRYQKIELEKMRQRLEKAGNEAIVAYNEIRTRINNGDSVVDALDIAKQKFREEHTINIAAAYLTRDILEVSQKDKKIDELNAVVSGKDETIRIKDETIEKREEQIGTLRSTLTTKENEYREATHQHSLALEELTKSSEKQINGIHTEYKNLLTQRDQQLDKADTIIEKMEGRINELNATVSGKDETINYLKAKVDALEKDKLQEMTEKIQAVTRSELYEKDLGELKKILESLKKENENLRSEIYKATGGKSEVLPEHQEQTGEPRRASDILGGHRRQ
jgi:hypothetical protein